MSTAKEICEGVSRSLLDSPVNDIHLSDIASHITEWRQLAPYLDLSEVEEKDIVDTYPDRPKLQRRDALRMWKEKNGNKATYRRLICILCSQGRVDTAQTLKKLLVSITEKKDTEQAAVIDSFHEYLCDCYSDLVHPSSLQWPLLTSYAGYVDLDLYEAPVSLTILMNAPMPFQSLKSLPLKSIFQAGDQKAPRQVVLVEGLAGSGKTTLCWYACKEWAAGRLFTNIRLLIHVSCSDTEVQSATKLADLIPHPSKDRREAVARAIADVRGKGVCFLFDGCDESPQLFARGSFLSCFMKGTGKRSMLPSASILLASRPSPEIFFYLLGCITAKVIVKGFKSLDEFIVASVPAASKRARLFDALELKPELYSLCCVPLHAVILIFLFDILQEDLPTTRTGLFHPLVRNFLLRHIKSRTTHQIGCIRDLSKDLPGDIYQSLCKISRLAYQSIIDRQSLVSQTMLASEGIDPASHDTFGFLNVHHKFTDSGTTNLYAFPHLSLQEFLAAFHITQLKKCDQITAFKQVYKQNPLSSVLSFYAGLTQLTVPNGIIHLLFEVMRDRFDLNAVVEKLQSASTYNPMDDKRRCLLGLMNCIYESQKEELIQRNVSFSPKVIPDTVMSASDFGRGRRSCRVELPFLYMDLYPTDCLSIGYFVRCACGLINETAHVYLNLSSCPLKTREIKALSQELCKPVRNRNLSVKLAYVQLSKESLQLIGTVLKSQSGLLALTVSGFMIEDMRLALKYFIEGLVHPNSLGYLGINDIDLASRHASPIIHHLVLLLCSSRDLGTLNLCGSKKLFANPRAMSLFCEALKYSKLIRLFLDGCNIDDRLLQLLAPALTDSNGCVIQALDICWNPYTSAGLTRFLRTLSSRAYYSTLLMLATNGVTDEHRFWVREFNAVRRQKHPFFGHELYIGGKGNQWEKEGESMHYLWAKPEHSSRNLH